MQAQLIVFALMVYPIWSAYAGHGSQPSSRNSRHGSASTAQTRCGPEMACSARPRATRPFRPGWVSSPSAGCSGQTVRTTNTHGRFAVLAVSLCSSDTGNTGSGPGALGGGWALLRALRAASNGARHPQRVGQSTRRGCCPTATFLHAARTGRPTSGSGRSLWPRSSDAAITAPVR